MAQGTIFATNTGISQWLEVFDEDGDALINTSTRVSIENYDGSLTTLKGTGFTFDSEGYLTGGTLTSVQYTSSNGSTIYASISGFSLPYAQWSDVSELDVLFEIILSGSDTLSINAVGTDDEPMELGGYDGNDTLNGGSGADKIWGDSGADILNGNGGDDMLIGGRGNDTLNGGAGFDQAYYNYEYEDGGTNAITVNIQNGTVNDAYNNTDTFTSIESFRGTMYADTFIGANQDYARYQGLAGNDTFQGGSGYDAVDYRKDAINEDINGQTGNSGVTVNLVTGKATDGYGDTDTLSNIDEVRGTDYADTLIGAAAGERLRGEDGDDTLRGNGGNDILEGGNGADTLIGGAGIDTMTGNNGNDTYYVNAYGDKVNEVAQQGTDLVISSSNYNLKANSQYIENITLTGNANLNSTGNMQANTMTGNAGNNKLTGLVGNDTLIGKGGADVLIGNQGNDTLIGNLGNDTLNGGLGLDTMSGNLGNDTYYVDAYGDKINEAANQGIDQVFSSSNYNLKANSQHIENITLIGKGNINSTGNMQDNEMVGNMGNNTLNGLAGNDTLTGKGGADSLYGGDGNDTLNGNLGNDKLFGGNGADKLFGHQGADILNGGNGNDILNGGIGNDTLYAASGADRLIGSLGADSMYAGVDNGVDTFIFNSINDSKVGDALHDKIYDFDSGEDQIDLSGIDANSSTGANDAFAFAGTTATANSVWYESDGSDIMLYADVNGDTTADFEVRLVDTSALTAADITL
nr:calcium-binding protein [uncultured Cohaesibacter sp.]